MPVRRKPITGGALFRAMNTPLCVIGKEKDKKMTIPMALMDFLPVELFNRAFFPAQSVGFVLLAVGMLALMYGRGKGRARSLTMVWVMLTVLGNMGMSAGLVYLARKVKRAAIPLFIVAFVLSMMMGYLSSRDFAQASMHWVAQSVNLLGEGLLFVGALLLHRAGLASPDALS